MQCSKGIGESRLIVNTRGVHHDGQKPMATTEDCVPLVNIPPFQGCRSPINPKPAPPGSPRPCVPQLREPWSDEIDFVTLQGKKLVEQRARLSCDYGGTIELLDVGQQGTNLDDNMLRFPSPFAAVGSSS